MNICVTGAAGFIGFHLAKRLLKEGYAVTGIDNLNACYGRSLKKARLRQLTGPGFRFHKIDICNRNKINKIFINNRFDRLIHLAAQAGVRYSLEAPHIYQRTNNEGFLNILEAVREVNIEHMVFASSSSVYGNNVKTPFSEHDRVDNPVSLYAATKRSSELTAGVYAKLFNIPLSGVRYFTVYGPWGRPDMALFKFTKLMLEGKAIEIYNKGQMVRNFTYIDDVVDGTIRVMNAPPVEKHEVALYNIGNNRAETVLDFVDTLESVLGTTARKKLVPMQPGDVLQTVADISKIRKLGYNPETSMRKGIENFVSWYKSYYR